MKKLIAIFLFNLFFLNPVKALEITNIEWTVLGDIQVTIYEAKENDIKISCTAFYIPENNKPIGGGFSYTNGNIAQVRIDLPGSYEKKNLSSFKIDCK